MYRDLVKCRITQNTQKAMLTFTTITAGISDKMCNGIRTGMDTSQLTSPYIFKMYRHIGVCLYSSGALAMCHTQSAVWCTFCIQDSK